VKRTPATTTRTAEAARQSRPIVQSWFRAVHRPRPGPGAPTYAAVSAVPTLSKRATSLISTTIRVARSFSTGGYVLDEPPDMTPKL
jgi:hypothetical protein